MARIAKLTAAALVVALGSGACHSASQKSIERRLAGRTFGIHTMTIRSRNVPILFEGAAYIDFQADHGVRVFTGCNPLTGRYAVKGDRLLISRALVTQIGCDAPRRQQEATLVRLVNGRPTMRLDGHRLTLTAGTTRIEAAD